MHLYSHYLDIIHSSVANIITLKSQHSAINSYTKGMWQLGFRKLFHILIYRQYRFFNHVWVCKQLDCTVSIHVNIECSNIFGEILFSPSVICFVFAPSNLLKNAIVVTFSIEKMPRSNKLFVWRWCLWHISAKTAFICEIFIFFLNTSSMICKSVVLKQCLCSRFRGDFCFPCVTA